MRKGFRPGTVALLIFFRESVRNAQGPFSSCGLRTNPPRAWGLPIFEQNSGRGFPPAFWDVEPPEWCSFWFLLNTHTCSGQEQVLFIHRGDIFYRGAILVPFTEVKKNGTTFFEPRPLRFAVFAPSPKLPFAKRGFRRRRKASVADIMEVEPEPELPAARSHSTGGPFDR